MGFVINNFKLDKNKLFFSQGTDGSVLSDFPVKLGGKVESRPLLIPLDLPNSNTLYIVQLAADGFIYVIDGLSGCYDKLNIGETSYSMILADDFNKNGKTDLLVSTSNGHIFLLSTNADFHPLHAWYIYKSYFEI